MSQLREFAPGETDPLFRPLSKIEDLAQIFHDSERKLTDMMMGIEYETFGQIDNGRKPLPYLGPISINRLFSSLIELSKNSDDPFLPLQEGDHLVGLVGKRAIIALEPGGQLEIAARPHRDLDDVTSIFTDVVHDIEDAATALGIDLFAVGIHPTASREDMATVKKVRYDIMRKYMNHIDGLGLDMMTRSCAIQLNLDFVNEKDMVTKTRLAACLVPFYSLFCASSAFVDGVPAKHAIERGHVWRKTDPARTGIPAIIFEETFGYDSWINMSLDIPMYFIRRDKIYHDVAGASFREFMTHGLAGHRATVRDFVDHLSTIFTEIRLKPILELRSADSLPVPFVNALAALTWALFYDEVARNKASAIFTDVTHQEVVALQNDAIDHGRQAKFRNRAIFSVGEDLLTIAQDALNQLAARSHKPHLAKLLTPIANIVANNTTVAEWIKAHFAKLDDKQLPKFCRSFSPFSNPLA